MANTVQSLLAESVKTASGDVLTALLSLPEDKRNWSPGGTARTALDMVAECAINNRFTADLIITREWQMNDMEAYAKHKAEVAASGLESLKQLLHENTAYLVNVIEKTADSDLNVEVYTPYGTGPLSGVMTYPYWNMKYHQGQITYIETLLETE
jgi:hypothetical protein